MNHTRTRWPRRLLGATLLLLTAMLGSCTAAPENAPAAVSSTATQPDAGYRNPVYGGSFPDPMVLEVDGEYYAYGTGERFPILRSSDLVRWSSAGLAMPARPEWSSGNSWAPSVHPVQRRCPDAPASSTSRRCYVMFYVGLNKGLARPANCIGVAVADTPAGPFRDRGILTATHSPRDPADGAIGCGDRWGYSNIDPSPFIGPDGQAYLYLSTGHDATGAWRRTISVIPLTDDLERADGDRVALFSMTQGWEGNFVEAPSMVLHRNRYYLFYSGGRFTDDTYAMGYAVADSPTGPFTKPADAPVLESTAQVIGPGGASLVEGPNARPWVVYHGRATPGGARTMRIDPLVWDDAATPPAVTVQGPSTATQPAP